MNCWLNFLVYWCQLTLDARGFLREEPWNGNKRSAKREKIEKTWENLWLPATVDWSYCANRFELGSRYDPASWLEEPYRCVVIGCLLINLVVLIDSYRSMIVRFASWVTRGFLSLLLSLSCLISSLRKKTSGTRVTYSITNFTLSQNLLNSCCMFLPALFLYI